LNVRAEVEGHGGWKMVPVEPTEQWVLKYCELTNRDPAGTMAVFMRDGLVESTFYQVAEREINAMLAASPAHPADHCMCPACRGGILHDSDCAVHNMPAYPNGPCDCSVSKSHPADLVGLLREAREAFHQIGHMQTDDWPGQGADNEELSSHWFSAFKRKTRQAKAMLARIDAALKEAGNG